MIKSQEMDPYCGLDGTGPCGTVADRTSSVVGALVGRLTLLT